MYSATIKAWRGGAVKDRDSGVRRGCLAAWLVRCLLSKHNVCVKRSLIAVLACVAGTSAGCNVDGMFVDRRPPPGPTVELTDPGGVEKSNEPVEIAIVDAQEVDLAEAVAAHRAGYHRKLEELRAYYAKHGYAHKEKWAAFELDGLRSVKAFRYVLDAEIPSDALRPEASIEEADALYAKGLELMRRGGHGVPALYREDEMIKAARLFRSLIEKYPNSNKIDDAAFMCGEIHKEYLPGQEALAVKWYERAWQWNPNTPHPARFQAALVYDYRLHDRDRALELYQSVVRHETAVKSNVRFATRRIHELTSERRGTSSRTARATRGQG